MLSRHGACRTRSRTLPARWASWRSNVATPNGWRPTTTPRADWRRTPPPPSKTYGQRVRRSAEQIYRAYLAQSQVFVGIYWQSYGWVAPGEPVSGLEDEYQMSAGMPRLI